MLTPQPLALVLFPATIAWAIQPNGTQGLVDGLSSIHPLAREAFETIFRSGLQAG